jgi:hypothetical protein
MLSLYKASGKGTRSGIIGRGRDNGYWITKRSERVQERAVLAIARV